MNDLYNDDVDEDDYIEYPSQEQLEEALDKMERARELKREIKNG